MIQWPHCDLKLKMTAGGIFASLFSSSLKKKNLWKVSSVNCTSSPCFHLLFLCFLFYFDSVVSLYFLSLTLCFCFPSFFYHPWFRNLSCALDCCQLCFPPLSYKQSLSSFTCARPLLSSRWILRCRLVFFTRMRLLGWRRSHHCCFICSFVFSSWFMVCFCLGCLHHLQVWSLFRFRFCLNFPF